MRTQVGRVAYPRTALAARSYRHQLADCYVWSSPANWEGEVACAPITTPEESVIVAPADLGSSCRCRRKSRRDYLSPAIHVGEQPSRTICCPIRPTPGGTKMPARGVGNSWCFIFLRRCCHHACNLGSVRRRRFESRLTCVRDALSCRWQLVILVFLFAAQSRGTAAVATLFGPIMVVWFVVIAAGGLVHVVANPDVLVSVNPWYGIRVPFQARPRRSNRPRPRLSGRHRSGGALRRSGPLWSQADPACVVGARPSFARHQLLRPGRTCPCAPGGDREARSTSCIPSGRWSPW